VFNDMPFYDGMDDDYRYLAGALDECGILYVHLVDHASMGAPGVPDSIKQMFRETFGGSLILSGGYDAARAGADLSAGRADLIAVGRPFLANPDLPARWQAGAELNAPDVDTFYTPGEKGYTDYPKMGK
jgi:N-ethylmaleimide reductase